jgi:hypothetical protein
MIAAGLWLVPSAAGGSRGHIAHHPDGTIFGTDAPLDRAEAMVASAIFEMP